MTEQQEVFNALKEVLITAPALCNPDSAKELGLGTNASFKDLDTVLSKQVYNSTLCFIAYETISLEASEKIMHYYSSVKLKELLALKRAVTENVMTIF